MADHNRHPDLHLVEAAEGSRVIKIQQARQAREMLQLRPVQAERRVVILREADRMTIEAANALLKTLEEPASFAHLVLTSANPRALPPTVRSRCQELRCQPLTPDLVAKALANLPEYEEKEIAAAAPFAQGSPGMAVQLLESGCLEIHEQILPQVLRLPDGDLFTLSEGIGDWLRSVSKNLEMQRNRLRGLLRLLACAYRDLLVLATNGASETLYHHREALAAATPAHARAGRLLLILDAVLEASRQTDANASIRLVLENLLGRIGELQAA